MAMRSAVSLIRHRRPPGSMTSTPNQPGAIARMNAPTVVTQRRPDSRIINIPIAMGTPTTRAITTSGRIVAFTSRVDATAAISPTAEPTSIALVSNHARGSGITLLTITRRRPARPARLRRAPRYRAGVDRLGHDVGAGLRRARPALVLGAGHRRMVRQQLILGVGEGAAAAQKPHALGRLEAEAAAATGHHVDDQLGVFPRLELRAGDPHRHAVGRRRRGWQAGCRGRRR